MVLTSTNEINLGGEGDSLRNVISPDKQKIYVQTRICLRT